MLVVVLRLISNLLLHLLLLQVLRLLLLLDFFVLALVCAIDWVAILRTTIQVTHWILLSCCAIHKSVCCG